MRTRFLKILLLAVGVASCSQQEKEIAPDYGQMLRGTWVKNIHTADYSAEVSINLNSSYTYTYSQKIEIDGEQISNSFSGTWEYSETANTIRLILVDDKDGTMAEEIGKVNISANTITFDTDEYRRGTPAKYLSHS